MERIREAVEQARRERQRSKPDVPAVAPASSGGESRPDMGPAAGGSARISVASDLYPGVREIDISMEWRRQKRLVAGIQGHPLQDRYRMLRTRVLQYMRERNYNTIAVTSPATGSGKSLTAINLAISIGRDLSSSAFLFDADLRHPSVAQTFGYEPEFGLNDYLFNNVPLEQALFRPNMDRLTVLPGREPIFDSAEMLTSPRFLSLMKDLRRPHDGQIVVIDIAPVLSVDDALALAPNVDCILLVTESGETKRDDLYQTLELLQDFEIVGTVLNKVDKKVAEAY